jgi:integrase
MPPERTGTVEAFKRADGSVYYRVRVRLADGTRERVDIPPKHAIDDARRALYAAAAQEREDDTGELLEKKRARLAAAAAQRDPQHGETCTAYRERLNAHRVEIGTVGKGGRADDESTWNAWIAKPLGALPIAKVTREDVEKFRDTLDGEIAKHRASAGREGLSPRRAINIWTVVTTTFKAAAGKVKRRDLRVREDNPCSGVEPPERGEGKRRTFIYPAELGALLGCTVVELAWRETYAIGAYLYLRPGELRALTWGDVDLVGGVVHITKAYDERTGETKAPKTGNGVRAVPIPATLVPLLERMKKEKTAAELVAPVLGRFTENSRAIRFRAGLRLAGQRDVERRWRSADSVLLELRICRVM